MIERKALIFNIQKYNMYDGPGVRTMVFFQGCPLRCTWCSNPEGQKRQPQVLCRKNICTRCGDCVPVCPVGKHRISPRTRMHEIVQDVDCIGCRRCEQVCKVRALSVMGELRTVAELADIVEEDRAFYEMSGGGVTLSGGEVLMQPEAAASLLMTCRRRGIGTAVETSGYARPEALARVAEFTDLFLYDVKHMDSARHYALTGVHNESILSNLRWLLDNRFNVKIRLPLLKGVNDGSEEIQALIRFLLPYREYRNFKGVDLLPYHRMGVGKYGQLGWDYTLDAQPSLTDADLERLSGWFAAHNFEVAVIRH